MKCVTWAQITTLAALAPTTSLATTHGSPRASSSSYSHTSSRQHQHVPSDAPLDAQIRGYLATIPGGVSGDRGSFRTYRVACKLVCGYKLTPEEALPYMAEWNLKCTPDQWSEKELFRKLNDATKEPGPRGYLIGKRFAPPGARGHSGDGSDPAEPGAIFRNYCWDERQEGETMRRFKRGRLAEEMFEELLNYTGGWPRSTGGILFAVGKHGKLQWLEGTNDLFAWICWQYGIEGGRGVDWAGGSDCIPQTQFHAFCKQHADHYEQIQLFPHQPRLPRTYYLHPEPTGGDGTVLRDLMRRFCPGSPIDEDLILAFLLTLFWGGPAGKRPAFVFQASERAKQAGRGAGKSTIPEFAARLIGGHIAIGANEEEGEMQRRLLGSAGRAKQLAIIDNIKTLRFSSSPVEKLITAGDISGRQMFVGEGSRPNYLTWVLTFNEPSMSKDMAQRSVVIEVDTPEYTTTWVRDIEAFIDEQQWAIIGDLLAILSECKPLPEGVPITRWGVWEGEVLSLLPDPVEAQRVIIERRKTVDDDEELYEHARELICKVIESEHPGIDPDRIKAIIPSSIITEEVVKLLHPKTSNDARAAMKWFYTMKIPGTSKNDTNTPYRGVVWCGKNWDEESKVKIWEIYKRK